MNSQVAARVRLTKVLSAKPKDVFEAWLSPVSLKEWMVPGDGKAAVPKLDAKVGGEYQIDMHVGDAVYVHTGKYREIKSPDRLVFTWISPGTDQQESLVTITCAPHDDGTLLTLVHEKLPSAEAGEQHSHGWQSILDKLAARFAR